MGGPQDLMGYSMIPQSPSDEIIMSSSLMDSDLSERLMQPPDEPPYFLEKWPGKLCSLCNLGERSQLGQGEMLRLEVKEGDLSLSSLNLPNQDDKDFLSPNGDKSPRTSSTPQLSNRRQKGLNKCK